MKKTLITGGAGFIGYHLAKNLLANDYKVDLLDNFSRGVMDDELQMFSKEKNIKIINLDLSRTLSVEQIDNNYDYIFHLAAIVGVKHVMENPYKVLDKNVILNKNALSICGNQKKLSRFIFFSTSEVYAGTLQNFELTFPTEESTPLSLPNLKDRRTTYMLSKIYGESMCHNAKVPFTIIRPHNFFGPRMGLSHVIPEIMKKIYDNKKGVVDVFSIDHKRTFCFIDDAVEIIRLLSESKLAKNEVYNVGVQDEEIRIDELVNKIINIFGKDISINPLPGTPGSPKRRCPSMVKAFKIIPYRHRFDLDKGLELTLNWYEKNVFNGNQESAL